ncbi:MIP18 family protein isoform X1 [Gossypium australe]|uniref:MIP18 family protein isoform X1 n=1 Tax=Gossypium australe TaxID=47621 RepID=A0A5B6VAE2_9ROSI|nr:MIP18 family protein isoform X1 [Gossypium australe]
MYGHVDVEHFLATKFCPQRRLSVSSIAKSLSAQSVKGLWAVCCFLSFRIVLVLFMFWLLFQDPFLLLFSLDWIVRFEETKVKVNEMNHIMSKITKHKLNGTNYFDWSKMIFIYLRSIDKDNHSIDDPLTDEKSRHG